MNILRAFSIVFAVVFIASMSVRDAAAQIVINELIVNDRSAGASGDPDVYEFVELYNTGNTPVDLTNWSFAATNLIDGATSTLFTIPTGTIAPGDYFVIGTISVSEVDLTQPSGMFQDSVPRTLQLHNNSSSLVDAVAYEVYRAFQSGSYFGVTKANAAVQAQVGSGYQAQLLSFTDTNTGTNQQTSWSRFRDGRDTNSNGRDFGHFPMTPGTTNNVIPVRQKHLVPNVDSLGVGTEPTQYNAPFVMPRVINPAVADGVNNFRVLTPSPQGGNALTAWDAPAGGGNSVYSEDLVNSFDLYAYFDTANLGVSGTAEQYEWTAYGIGTTDPRFSIADPLNMIASIPAATGSASENASTGLGWFYQQFKASSANGGGSSSRLLLIDFGDGGISTSSAEWNIKVDIDMSVLPADWYRLSISYDPATGNYTARFGDQTYSFTTDADRMGQFYVGWREVITATSPKDIFNPPVWDLVESGDFDGDGDVDGADFIAWQTNYPTNAGASAAMGDANNDGDVDGGDFAAWQNGFTTGSPGSSPVPEPAAAMTFAIAMAAFSVVAYRSRSAKQKSA